MLDDALGSVGVAMIPLEEEMLDGLQRPAATRSTAPVRANTTKVAAGRIVKINRLSGGANKERQPSATVP